MENEITIIEGPSPIFEPVQENWALSLTESSSPQVNALTKLRTFNGPKLVERCYRTWRSHHTMYLHYKNELGLEQKTPIQAAHTVDTDDGHVLHLWVYLDPTVVEFEFYRDDNNDDDGLEN